ncbi:flagellar hook-length control protein FliK [Bdellovibrio sp. HCB117]|uniref:flagellar hook-length control protein FliK n=1 Tax=Bdellovibrio sp. HCB117 TaxID=3394359 RepID=UPI0039B49A2E
MLQSIVGPPMVGATDLRSQPERTVDKDFKGSGSESSFGKALEDKMSAKSPKESKEVKESPQKEARQKEEKEPQQAKAEAKKEQPVDKTEGKIAKKAVRQQAIQEFMDSFESEFQIPPTRLVEAMAQLDDKQLTQSPEVTAEAVIDQLGLSEADAEKAQAMYAALLVQLSQMPTQQQPKPTPEMVTGGAGMTQQNMQMRVATAQGKQDALTASVDRMNKKFWTTPEQQTPPTAMPSLDAALAQNLNIDEESMSAALDQEVPMEAPPVMEMPEAPANAKPLPELPPHLKGQMNETMSPALLAALAAKQAAAKAQGAEGQPAAEQAPELMNEFQQVAQAPKLEKPQALLAGQVPQANAKMANQEFFQNQSQGQMMQQNSQNLAQQGMSSEKESALTKLTTKSADFQSSLSGLEAVHAQPIKGEALGLPQATPVAAAVAPTPVNQTENEAAVKQLMNQAQYLIKKGGGEMKVQMTPEGMGTIHLKVMLQDGKVNMQMSADTQEAKKAIESSLAELKTSLAAHKLSMENVKVDVVNSTSADTAMQNQTNNNGNQQRDQARQFWNQFNENFGSQGRREGYSEMPNLKGYGMRNRDPLQPIETSSTARSSRKVEGKGSGLNLVA